MASPNEDERNPYQSPVPSFGPVEGQAAPARDRGMVKKFCDQIHALGA